MIKKMWEIKSLTIEDKNYPTLLKEIKNPPKVLYYVGEIKDKENCIAIVGARRCTNYGKEVAYQIASELANAGITVVSGFAPGIDTMAHLGAIENKKRTIAVLGTGLNEKSIYPKSNLKLAKKILECGGALISEFPPATHGTKYTFPLRNRIISGLSLGVLVVEAKLKSGALITANYAFEQKRKIFAIPGPIFSQTSKGCHFLIKNGAKLVENGNDILEDLGLKIRAKRREVEGENKEETTILKVLKEGALSVEKIIEKTNFPASKVLAILSILEIKGKIKNLGGQIYAISDR